MAFGMRPGIEQRLFGQRALCDEPDHLPLEDPSTGASIGVIAAGQPTDIDAAVAAANAGPSSSI